ncbi:MAG TPA: YCF48-related protein [Vicinamibacteria bacterium]|nr:YCF48-related protein [Vicinamibacteria bacterium]
MVKGGCVITAVLALGPGAGAVEEPAAIMAPLAARSLLLDAAVAGERLVAVGERGHILISTDGGAAWRQVKVPTRTMLTAVFFHDGKLGWAVGHDALILRSTDGGETWRQVHHDPEAGGPLFDVYFLDDQRGFAVGAYGLFLETNNGGESWERRTISDGDAHLHHLARSATGRLYLAAERGVLFRSDDGGERWTELPSPYQGSLFGSLPLAGEDLLLFGLRGHAFFSGDAGKTWSPVATGVDTMLTGGCRLKDGRIVVGGLGGVVLVSGDQGRSFSLHEQGDRLGISAVIPAPDGGIVLTGEFGVRKMTLAAPAVPAK